MKLLVCGGRGYQNREAAFDAFDRAHEKRPITLLIHGACVDRKSKLLRGADRWAEEWALAREIPYVGVPAQWSVYGRSAGPLRNQYMLDSLRPDCVLALPGHEGTDDMVRRAHAAGLEVWKPYKKADT